MSDLQEKAPRTTTEAWNTALFTKRLPGGLTVSTTRRRLLGGGLFLLALLLLVLLHRSAFLTIGAR